MDRVHGTLELMHRWGYAPTVQALADELVGGPVSSREIQDVIGNQGSFLQDGDFVCLPGEERLVAKSRDRERMNRLMNGHGLAIAEVFARELVRMCPFVDCVALSGSVASGGYIASDDIDFDLFVQDGTKYITYAISLALGLQFSLREAASGPVRKVTCINVIWTREQTSPFTRTDSDLAFELLRCRPLIGGEYFHAVLSKNDWVSGYFPQVARPPRPDLPRPPFGFVARCLARIAMHPPLLRLAERCGRMMSFLVYTGAHWMRRSDASAMQRFAFLQRVKYPYEVFQD